MYLTYAIEVILFSLGTTQLEILKVKLVLANKPVSGIIEASPPFGGSLPVVNS